MARFPSRRNAPTILVLIQLLLVINYLQVTTPITTVPKMGVDLVPPLLENTETKTQNGYYSYTRLETLQNYRLNSAFPRIQYQLHRLPVLYPTRYPMSVRLPSPPTLHGTTSPALSPPPQDPCSAGISGCQRARLWGGGPRDQLTSSHSPLASINIVSDVCRSPVGAGEAR